MSQTASPSKLQRFPMKIFTIVMGLGGFCLNAFQAEAHPNTPDWFPYGLSVLVAWLALAVFAFLLSVFILKVLIHPRQIAKEFNTHETSGLFATIPISMVLLSGCFFEISLPFAKGLWMTGATIQLLVSVLIVNQWMYGDMTISKITPIWFIPVVGNMMVPVTGVWFAPIAFSWMFFSIGVLFWLLIFTLLMHRLILDTPLPRHLRQTMFILLAPPSIGFMAITTMQPELDTFSYVLYFNAIFIFLLLAIDLPNFVKLPFSLSSWSYAFPLAAMTLATMRMHEFSHVEFIGWLAWALFVALSALIAWLSIRTIICAMQDKLIERTP